MQSVARAFGPGASAFAGASGAPTPTKSAGAGGNRIGAQRTKVDPAASATLSPGASASGGESYLDRVSRVQSQSAHPESYFERVQKTATETSGETYIERLLGPANAKNAYERYLAQGREATSDEPPIELPGREGDDRAENAREQYLARVGESEPGNSSRELTDEERKEVDEMRRRDAQVRRQEAARAAAGGRFARAPTFEYETGPDGRRYVIDGSVRVDASEVDGDPESTLEKMRAIRQALNMGARPSAHDYRLATEAGQAAERARREIAVLAARDRRTRVEGQRNRHAGEVLDGASNDAGPSGGGGAARIAPHSSGSAAPVGGQAAAPAPVAPSNVSASTHSVSVAA